MPDFIYSVFTAAIVLFAKNPTEFYSQIIVNFLFRYRNGIFRIHFLS